MQFALEGKRLISVLQRLYAFVFVGVVRSQTFACACALKQ